MKIYRPVQQNSKIEPPEHKTGNAALAALTNRDKRPEANLQLKLQAMADCAALGTRTWQLKKLIDDHTHRQSAKSPIQRKIIFKEETWGEGTAEEFRRKYGVEVEKIVREIGAEVGLVPKDLEGMLASELVVSVTDGGENGYQVYLINKTEETRTGTSRTVWGTPLAMSRPAKGIEEMKVSGLSDCVGVFAYLTGSSGVEKVAGLHFVTALCMQEDGSLNDTGTSQMQQLLTLLNGEGRLCATIVRSGTGKVGSLDKRSHDAYITIAFYLIENGFSEVSPLCGKAEANFLLNHDGRTKIT